MPTEHAESCAERQQQQFRHLAAILSTLQGVPVQLESNDDEVESLFGDLDKTMADLGDELVDLAVEPGQAASGSGTLALDQVQTIAQNATANPTRNPILNPRYSGKIIPVTNWNLKFSGEPHSKLSFAEFLREVHLKRDESNLTEHDFWRSAHGLFEDSARVWFITNKLKWSSWAEFEPDFLRNFKPARFDDRLWNQLRLRTQGRHERLNLYVAEMTHSFNLLASAPTESEKLEFIKARLNPETTRQIPLREIISLDALITAGLDFEVVQGQVDDYRDPAAPDNPALPSLVYKDPVQKREKNAAKASSVHANKRGNKGKKDRQDEDKGKGDGGAKKTDSVQVAVPQQNMPTSQDKPRYRFKCWNCDKPGHSFKSCKEKQTDFFCWGCGQKGVTQKSCTSSKCTKSKNP
ncbi:uncharacterized protein LOC135946499 [Cloeon dipterum]|uniref:uncharacterized protein LOC135946499 n=1 Tax=Cloeon dipterum TaxID=197152 RepID=UPI0032204E19